MRAMDVMTSEVITVDQNATVPEAAKLLTEHGISAVPVVDKGDRVIGMVSEGDLLHRAETGTERRRSWWLEMVSSTTKPADEYIKSHSRYVKDVMTRGLIIHRGDPGCRYRRSVGDQPDQAGASPARWQACRHRQQSEPRAGTHYDDQRGGGWRGGR